MKKIELSKKSKSILLVVFIFVLIFASTKLSMYFINLNASKELFDSLISEVLSVDIAFNNQDIVKVDFDKLLNINEDTVGWIRFNNEKINYPVVQANDNEYYLKYSFDKSYNQCGSIFMDYRNFSFDDKNVVLFGHAMSNNSMFGSLKDVFDKDFFENEDNNFIQIITPNNETLTYQIFSYYTIEKEEYYITTAFYNRTEFIEFINTIRNRSYKKFNVEVDYLDNILTLSTCHGSNGTSVRKVIHAKRVS